ncbi:hypothetical protein ScoT_24420 [Streptomyces albidoflavus]|uniref:Uncharacterized protein n=1 Tax=Streptomyces albidoflavus TaxID=1886 RepID=A0AA37BWJ4_9ACTN|nr:hypothetical protein ScoT_24420 [Streptomyces albidoflavus]
MRRHPGTAPPHPRAGGTANLTARPAFEAIGDRRGGDGAQPPPAQPAPEAPLARDRPDEHPLTEDQTSPSGVHPGNGPRHKGNKHQPHHKRPQQNHLAHGPRIHKAPSKGRESSEDRAEAVMPARPR